MTPTAIGIDKLRARVKDAQTALFDLFRQEEQLVLERDDLAIISAPDDKNDKAITLWSDARELAELARDIRVQAETVMSRLGELESSIRAEIEKAIGGVGEKIITPHWEARLQKGKGSVQIKDLKAVPKMYRRPPKPLPPEEDWDVDKNLVARRLENGEVKTIPGVVLVEGVSLRVKPR